MPAHPIWFHRLPEILTTLRNSPLPFLDRLAVQNLFHVRERRARQIMAGLPGLQVGNAFAVERLALLRHLESTAAGDRFQWETTRRARLTENLDRSRRQLAARSVRLPLAAPVPRPACTLPAGMELRAGELRIPFCGPEDLAAKLFQLSQTMADDWPAFAEAVGR